MKKVTNRLLQFSLKDHPLNRFECKKRKISFRLTTCLFIIKRIEIESYEIGSYYATWSKRTIGTQLNLLLSVRSNSLYLIWNLCKPKIYNLIIKVCLGLGCHGANNIFVWCCRSYDCL